MKIRVIDQLCLAVLFLTLPTILIAQSMNQNELDKLDPRFRAVIVRELPSLRITTFAPGITVFAPRIAPAEAHRRDGTDVYGAIVYTNNANALKSEGIEVNSVLPNFVTARITPMDMVTLAKLDAVIYVDPGRIDYPLNDIAVGAVGADVLHAGFVNSTQYKGKDVIVCIIDSGIDWKHGDFRDPTDNTQSRILYIWDQTLTPTGGESSPSETGCGYGVEYTTTQIEDEIDGSPAGFVREQDTYGHGTHVAGTAAGNGAALSTQKYSGLAPEADIIMIKAGNSSFSYSNIINGLSYARQKAAALGKAVVVNMSLGSNAGPHDGTDSKSVAIDDFSGAGRVVAVSAGNSGDEDIHISGSTSIGGFTNITFTVPAYTAQSGSDNDDFDFDMWFDSDGDVSAQVATPNDYTASQTAGGSSTTNTNDGAIYLYNYTDASNGDRHIYLSVYDDDETKPPVSGAWTLKVTNNSGSSIEHHGWLYDATIGSPSAAVSLTGSDSFYTLSNTANSAIIVGSYVHRWRWSNSSGSGYYYGSPDRSDDISAYSSIGPTRDGAQKPDIAAPGQGVGSSTSQDYTPASSSILPGQKHHINQGTSMASPVVAGAVALLLDQDMNITAATVKSLLTDNADTDIHTGTVWNASWGFGKLDIFKAMVKNINSGLEADREIFAYDQWDGSASANVTGSQKVAVRFTPSMNGVVTGFFFHPSTTVNVTAPLKIEIWSDNGSGLPDTKLGSTVNFSQDEILKFSWNFINLAGAGVCVTSGTDYHAVLSFSNVGDNMFLRNDNGSATNRSSFFDGASWSQITAYDLRLRPVVSQYGVSLEAKIFLEGPYNTGTHQMTTSINGIIPTTSPYAEDTRTVNSIPANVTDWVLVQLRSTATGAAVASKSAFLHQDGRIMADDGSSGQITLNASAGDYYIVIKHRNHLAVMSANPVALSSGSSTLYDFTTGSSQFYGTGGAKEIETGVWGMWSGDINQDGEITTEDYTTWYNSARAGDSGYQTTDINLDGEVTTSDYTTWYNNARAGASSAVP